LSRLTPFFLTISIILFLSFFLLSITRRECIAASPGLVLVASAAAAGSRPLPPYRLLVVVVGVLLGLLEPVDEGLGGVAHLLARLLRVRVGVGVRVRPWRWRTCSGRGEGEGEG
jgi:hypothetical protein